MRLPHKVKMEKICHEQQIKNRHVRYEKNGKNKIGEKIKIEKIYHEQQIKVIMFGMRKMEKNKNGEKIKKLLRLRIEPGPSQARSIELSIELSLNFSSSWYLAFLYCLFLCC
jgi:hypothetical protein